MLGLRLTWEISGQNGRSKQFSRQQRFSRNQLTDFVWLLYSLRFLHQLPIFIDVNHYWIVVGNRQWPPSKKKLRQPRDGHSNQLTETKQLLHFISLRVTMIMHVDCGCELYLCACSMQQSVTVCFSARTWNKLRIFGVPKSVITTRRRLGMSDFAKTISEAKRIRATQPFEMHSMCSFAKRKIYVATLLWTQIAFGRMSFRPSSANDGFCPGVLFNP